MKTTDLVSTAAANTFRSKTRTILTVLAIFVGAFTLTLTNGSARASTASSTTPSRASARPTC